MANKVVGFEIRFEGFTELIKLNDSLKDQKKILAELRKSHGETSDEYLKQAEVVGKLQAAIKQKKIEQSKEIAEQKKAAAESEKALKQSGKELDAYEQKSKLLNMLRKDYKALAASEGETTDETRQLLKEIQKLDKELKEIDSSVGQNQRNVGNYSSAFEGLSGIMSGSLSSALSATGVGMAAVAGIELASEIVTQVKEITDEFIQLRGEIQQLTNVTGKELDNFTISVSAIAETFGKDTNEVTLAANALAKNMGISFDESLGLIEQGFLSGADANGEFLRSVSEYPSFFKDAGASGEQFISIITQQIKSGVFSDKGVDAFKEAKLSLTELPKSAVDALKAIGISSVEIRDKIDKDGVGGAIQLVAKKMGTLEKDSPAVGKALADIFKGAGEDAGASFIIDSFSNMDTKMVDLIDSSNGLTQKQLTLLDANKGLATAQNELTLALSGSGISFDGLLINVQTLALSGLVDLINIVKDTIGIFAPFFDLISDVGTELGVTTENTDRLSDSLFKGISPISAISTALSGLAEGASFVAEKIRDLLEYVGLLEEKQTKGNKANAHAAIMYKGAGDGAKQYKSEAELLKAELVDIEKQMQKNAIMGKNDESLNKSKIALTKRLSEVTKTETKTVDDNTKTKDKNTKTRKESAKQIEAESGSVKDLTTKISKLRQEIDNTSDENVIAAKLKEISEYETQLDATKQKIEDLSKALKRANDVTGIGTAELGRSTLPSFLDSDLVETEKQKSEKLILDYLGKTGKFTKEFNEQQNVLNAEKYAAEFENEQLFFAKRLDALDLFYETGLLKEEDYNTKKKELNQEIFDYSVGIANESVKTIGMIQDAQSAKEMFEFTSRTDAQRKTLDDIYEKELEKAEGNAAATKAIKEKYEKESKSLTEKTEFEKLQIENKYAKKRQNLAVVQAIIDGASGIVKTGANLGYPLAIPFQILQGIQTIAQIAAIKAQKFATGGRVKGSNIPTQANGDSVLATLKPREIVLTESDQNVLGGVATFDKLVNGRNRFATGGMVAPSVTPSVSRETSFNMAQNNDAVFELINAVNERIDRIEVVADPSQIVRQGDKQIKKVKMKEV